jgi:hypothetical protein
LDRTKSRPLTQLRQALPHPGIVFLFKQMLGERARVELPALPRSQQFHGRIPPARLSQFRRIAAKVAVGARVQPLLAF